MPKTLILAIVGQSAAQSAGRSRKMFGGQGGSIGRGSDCDWVLNASGVSRMHATIRFLNGLYFLEDRSTNGVLLNGAILAKGEPAALNHGDRLQIDAFEMEVSLRDSESKTGEVCAAEAVSVVAHARRAVSAAAPSDVLPRKIHDDLSGRNVDPLEVLAGAAPVAPAAAGSWNHSPGIDDHFQPPGLIAKPASLPENWDRTLGDFSSASLVAPAIPTGFERIYHIVTNGVMDMLRTRAEIKRAFRLPVTIIQRSENNPLKFAATPEEAMRKIMAPQDSTFLTGGTAFEDAFDDIRCHQMAMLAGMRTAFDGLLSHFHPDRFEQRPRQASRRPVFVGKGRCWDRYRKHFEDLAKDREECFRQLYGEEFARAYEARLAQLKSVRRTQARRSQRE